MNKHILLVMKWLNNKESVSQKELEANRDGASDAVDYDADCAAYGAYNAAACAAYGAYNAAACAAAAYWVDKYFKQTGENKEEYRKELNK
jgi:hypothetical protein